MKAKIIKEEKFTPVTIELTFETKKEIQALACAIGYTSAQEKHQKVTNKVKNSPSLYKGKGLEASDFIGMEIICETLSSLLEEDEY